MPAPVPRLNLAKSRHLNLPSHQARDLATARAHAAHGSLHGDVGVSTTLPFGPGFEQHQHRQQHGSPARAPAGLFSGVNRRVVDGLRRSRKQLSTASSLSSSSSPVADSSASMGPALLLPRSALAAHPLASLSSSPSSGGPLRSLGSTALAAVAAPAPSAQSTHQATNGGVPNLITTVDVDLGDRSYPIYIGENLLADGALLRKHIPGKKALVVTNETIAPLYLDQCRSALEAGGVQVESVVLPDGEEFKTMEVLQQVWDKALQARLDRGATFVALGGGVVGDMTGFAAACYQRGVHFVQVPTTVMAQVDSSVGGKTGVNHPLGKNMIGAFYQPLTVLVDTTTLSTLPDRELASGLSEIVKYGLIRDAPLFEWLEANVDRLLARDVQAIAYAVERSCVNKAEVVASDEREGGVRATLNLGHTFGHAIETATGYGSWLHGEAVSAGTCMAADLSARLGWITPELRDRTVALMERCRLPIRPPPEMTREQFRTIMAVDKKVLAGKLRLVLLKGPLGGCVVTGDFDPAKFEETLAHYCAN